MESSFRAEQIVSTKARAPRPLQLELGPTPAVPRPSGCSFISRSNLLHTRSLLHAMEQTVTIDKGHFEALLRRYAVSPATQSRTRANANAISSSRAEFVRLDPILPG